VHYTLVYYLSLFYHFLFHFINIYQTFSAEETKENKELISIKSEFMYQVERGSQVELPCILPGRTSPNIWHKDGVSYWHLITCYIMYANL